MSDKTKARKTKRHRLDNRDNKGENDLDKDESEINDAGYVSSLFISFFLLFWKKKNRLTDLSKKRKSLNYLVYIPKISYLEKCSICIKVLRWKEFKNTKEVYTSYLREGLEFHLASTASRDSSTIKQHCLIRIHLESHASSNHHQGFGIQICTNKR